MLSASTIQRVFDSPGEEGFYEIVSPRRTRNKAITVYRLNLSANRHYVLRTEREEMNALLIRGTAAVSTFGITLSKNDSFYLPGTHMTEIAAGSSGAEFYIAAAVCEGYGNPFFRKYDVTLPLGDIHQIHGTGSGAREVYFTLDENVPASRLICGFTVGGDGMWTSWPPHEHEKDLEEAYCYYDMPAPKLGFQLYYPTGGKITDAVFQPVRSGSVALAADGYHPTVATPGTRNTYFWVMASFSHEQRSYHKAKTDPLCQDV